ncbi:MAG: NADH-quinone oxidoreductase subunit A [Deltaproteobacteria bacterium HGW-Deltaproteobacteria-15]|jgi:NADH-quinone oxidoreductase subunit A|nr:MAG: NADH-quinone oxidoreductase subunit A [Deltaproteobacteria bacterium HGW-Deltaproteobacteria-15]
MSPVSESELFSPWVPGLLPLVIYAVMVLGLVAVLLFLAGWLGEKKIGLEKSRPYESGIVPTGPALLNYPVPFYLVAVFFLIFDVEAVYIFSWAAAFEPLGWYGWLEISLFITILIFGLVYIWRKGGLEWGPTATNTKHKTSC